MLKLFKKSKSLYSNRNIQTIMRQFSQTLIKNGTVVNADSKFRGDVVIENGKIHSVHKPEDKIADQKNFAKIHDATGKYIMPGGIDPHVHLEL